MTSIINQTQLTNNTYSDNGSQVSIYGEVSWNQVLNGTDPDVLYQTLTDTTATRIGNTSRSESNVNMSNSGGVVFQDYNAGNYDLQSNTGLRNAPSIAVDQEPKDAYHAQASGLHDVVYEYAFSPTDHDIRLFNSATNVTKLVASSSENQTNPDMAGDFIVYEQETAPGSRDLYEYSVSTGISTKIAGDVKDEFNAHVADNGNVVYQLQYGAGDSDIYFYNATTGATTALARGGFDESNPQINGSYAVWEAWDGNDYEVFRFDAATGETRQLTDNTKNDRNAQVSENGMVVYEHQFSATDMDVYLYDGRTNLGVAVSSQHDEYNPHINGTYVSWEMFDGNDGEIFRAQIAA
jgi:Tol biopolymer transport system component